MAEQNTTDKLTLAKFEEAYDIVQKVVLPTKLIYSDYFSGITGNKVYFKPENLQKTGAYKIRGACPGCGICCKSIWSKGDHRYAFIYTSHQG